MYIRSLLRSHRSNSLPPNFSALSQRSFVNMSYPDKALDLAANNGKTHLSPPVPEFSVCLPASLEPIEELPQVDGGPAAWRFLFAIFVMEALQWGKLTPINRCHRLVLKAVEALPSTTASFRTTTLSMNLSEGIPACLLSVRWPLEDFTWEHLS